MKIINITVLILNWNGTKDTLECIKSLEDTNYPNFSIKILDNGSNKEEYHKLLNKSKSHRTHIYRSEENLGFAGGNNLLLSKIDDNYDYIMLLNNDTVVDKDIFYKLALEVAKNNLVHIIGPTILNYRSRTIQSAGAKINLYTGSTHILKTEPNSIAQVDMISGCCMLISKNIIDKINLFKKQYFAYYEETDFCTRAKKEGYYSYVTSSCYIEHKGSVTSKKTTGFQEVQLIKNRFLFIRYNGNKLQKLTTILFVSFYYLPLRTLKLILLGQAKTIGYLFIGYISGIKYLLCQNTII